MGLYNLLDSFEKTLYIHTLYAKIFGSTVVYVANYSKTIKKRKKFSSSLPNKNNKYWKNIYYINTT